MGEEKTQGVMEWEKKNLGVAWQLRNFNMYDGAEEVLTTLIKVSVTTSCTEFGVSNLIRRCPLVVAVCFVPSRPMLLAIPLLRHKGDLSPFSLLLPAYRSPFYLLHIPFSCCPPRPPRTRSIFSLSAPHSPQPPSQLRGQRWRLTCRLCWS